MQTPTGYDPLLSAAEMEERLFCRHEKAAWRGICWEKKYIYFSISYGVGGDPVGMRDPPDPPRYEYGRGRDAPRGRRSVSRALQPPEKLTPP